MFSLPLSLLLFLSLFLSPFLPLSLSISPSFSLPFDLFLTLLSPSHLPTIFWRKSCVLTSLPLCFPESWFTDYILVYPHSSSGSLHPISLWQVTDMILYKHDQYESCIMIMFQTNYIYMLPEMCIIRKCVHLLKVSGNMYNPWLAQGIYIFPKIFSKFFIHEKDNSNNLFQYNCEKGASFCFAYMLPEMYIIRKYVYLLKVSVNMYNPWLAQGIYIFPKFFSKYTFFLKNHPDFYTYLLTMVEALSIY